MKSTTEMKKPDPDPSEKLMALMLKPMALMLMIGGVLLLFAYFYKLREPCQTGLQRSLLLSCNPYRSFGDVHDLPKGTFRYGGSTALIILVELASAVKSADPQSGFDLDSAFKPGQDEGVASAWSTEGIKKLIEGKDNFAVAFSSRDLTPEEEKEAKDKNFTLEKIPVAKDGLVVFISSKKENQIDIKDLTKKQIKDIYTGQITNWSGVNSSGNLKIGLFSPDPTKNDKPPYEWFQETILEKSKFDAQTKEQNNITNLVKAVNGEAGGIGFASSTLACDQDGVQILAIRELPKSEPSQPCMESTKNKNKKEPNLAVFKGEKPLYPLTRTLYAIIRVDGTDSEKAGKAFVSMILSEDGQKLLADKGYAPIR